MAIPDKQIPSHFHAQQALTQDGALFRALIENSSDIVILITADGLVRYVSPSITHVMGYPPDAFLGHQSRELVHPDDLERMQNIFGAILQSPGKSLQTEYRLRCQDGSWRWFEGVGTNLLDDPQVGAIVGNFRDITERKQAKEALHEEEQRFRMVWDCASDAMALSDAEGRVLAANPAYYQLYGFTPEDVIGNSFAIIFSHEQQEWATTQYKTIFESGKGDTSFESTVLRADGTIRIVETTYDFLIQHGRRIAMISIIRDITERKEAEKARHQLAAMVESSDDAIIGKTIDGIITSWNSAAERIYGYTAEEAVGQPITLIFPAERQDEFVSIMQQLQNGERIDHYETTRVRKDGHILPVSVTISPIKDSAGKIIGASAIARDISQQKRLEAELRQSRQQLEVIFKNIADGVSVQDVQGNVVYMNDAGARLCGYSSTDELLARSDFQSQRAYTLQRFEMRDEQGNPLPISELPGSRAARGESHPQTIMQYYDTVSQTRRWSLVKARPILDEKGKVQLTVTIFSDITDTYEAEQKKDEFIGIASHELKTPMTALKGLSQLLKRRLEKQGATEPVMYLARIDEQVNRLTRLVNDLLDMSKIRAGRLDYAEEPIALDAFIHDIVESIQQITPSHTLVIYGASNKEIIGDSNRLEQVFLNLINNAVKYSPQASTVDIHIATSHDKVMVSVQDYGVGIPKEHQSKIFDRFYRVYDARNKTFRGLGMGLYIAYEIVKRHGGDITVESEEDKGSTFSVYLPLT